MIKDILDIKNKKIWIIIALILIIIFSNQLETDKKESTSEWGRVGVGIGLLVIGIGLFFVPGMQMTAPIIIAIGAIWAGAGTTLIGGIAGLLTPDIGIPSWALILGFIVLIFVVLKKK